MTLQIRLNPNAKKNTILRYEDDTLYLKIVAPPVDGKANKELITFIAKQFHVPKSHISFIRGEKSRTKVLDIPIDKEVFLEILHEITG